MLASENRKTKITVFAAILMVAAAAGYILWVTFVNEKIIGCHFDLGEMHFDLPEMGQKTYCLEPGAKPGQDGTKALNLDSIPRRPMF